jgi:ribosomal protein L35AE/L33A
VHPNLLIPSHPPSPRGSPISPTRHKNADPPQRIAYVYKAKREINGSRVRVIWGRISRPHGNSGVVKGKFTSNLPAKVFGASCRIMLFPSTI